MNFILIEIKYKLFLTWLDEIFSKNSYNLSITNTTHHFFKFSTKKNRYL